MGDHRHRNGSPANAQSSRSPPGLGERLLREGLLRAGGLRLDIRTRTDGYYERLGASRSLGFRLRREQLLS